MKCTRNRGHRHVLMQFTIRWVLLTMLGHDQVALCKTLEGLKKDLGLLTMFIGIANCRIFSCRTFPTSLMSIRVKSNTCRWPVSLGDKCSTIPTQQLSFKLFFWANTELEVAELIRVSLRLIMLCSRRGVNQITKKGRLWTPSSAITYIVVVAQITLVQTHVICL